MKRRKFIRDVITGLPLFAMSQVTLTGCDKDDHDNKPIDKTVIIIGAGIAGLAAALKLKQKFFTVIILEAQDKVGGRIRTDRSLGIAFDEGASWIHGPQGNPITGLASQAGATTFLTNDDNVSVYDINGAVYSDNNLTTAEIQFNNALGAIEAVGNINKSFQQVFQQLFPSQADNRLWTYFLSAYLEFDTGGDISKLSSQYFYDDESFEGSDVFITNGYDTITDFMAQGLDVRLNTRVTHIDYTSTKVQVLANNKSFEADHVIVTVPLGVLKNGAIHFNPSLPNDMTTAISKTNMGNVNKFLLVWDNAFWETDLQYIGFTPATKGKFNYFVNLKKFSPANALMTFALGDYATFTESLPDDAVLDDIMSHLKKIYGSGIQNPTHMLRTKWGQNIHAFGAYAYATTGTTTADFDTMAKSVNNKLFFAGEHTNKNYRGTVHGAYLSGIREADKIIRL